MAEIVVASWRKGFESFAKGADAQKCYEEIGDTGITPEELLEKARNESTELHKCFTWEDSEAAEKWRIHEARRIIQTLVIRVEETEVQPQREFRLLQPSSEPKVYQPIQFFARNQDEYEKLLERAKDELRRFKERYKEISELENVILAIEEVV